MPTYLNQTTDSFEARKAELRRQQEEKTSQSVACPKCASQWFRELEVSKFLFDHSLLPGQAVPKNSIVFKLLECIRCRELIEPRLNTYTIRDTNYDSLLDTLEGKGDLRDPESQPMSNLGATARTDQPLLRDYINSEKL